MPEALIGASGYYDSVFAAYIHSQNTLSNSKHTNPEQTPSAFSEAHNPRVIKEVHLQVGIHTKA